jgi:cytochrome c
MIDSTLTQRATIHRLVVALGALVLCLAHAGTARAADAASGKALFDKTCANCHSIEAGVNKVGPTLFDVVDRPVAAVQGYDYSSKMRAVGKQRKVWDDKQLGAYLSNPRQVLHGVKMFFAVPDTNDRANVIAYLNTLR